MGWLIVGEERADMAAAWWRGVPRVPRFVPRIRTGKAVLRMLER